MTDEEFLWIQPSRELDEQELKRIQTAWETLNLPYRIVIASSALEPLSKGELRDMLQTALQEVEENG